jgi:hypothetical protein
VRSHPCWAEREEVVITATMPPTLRHWGRQYSYQHQGMATHGQQIFKIRSITSAPGVWLQRGPVPP